MIKVKDNHVISRKLKSNKIVSVFGDDIWNLSPYRIKERSATKINFKEWLENSELHTEIIYQMKVLSFLFWTEAVGGQQSVITAQTLCGNYAVLFKRLARFAISRNMLISDVLQSTVEIKRFANKEEHKPSLGAFASLLMKLIEMGEKKTGMCVLRGEHITHIRSASKRQETNQAEFIPQRLFTEFITHWQESLIEFELHWNSISRLLDIIHEQPGAGISIGHQRNNYGKSKGNFEPEFIPLCKQCRLIEYFESYGIKGIKSLSAHLTYIQSVGKAMVHVYSGMRFDEANSLTVNSLQKERVDSNLERWILKGETTKHIGTKKQTYWVTSKDLGGVWNVLSCLSNYIAKRLDVKDQPLFIAISYLELSCKSVGIKDGIRCSKLIEIDPLKYLGDSAIITSQDMEEMRNIRPQRDLNDPDYSIGKRWKIRSHQFRRTIAILAAQSGLVSIPSLKRQLQHLTEEMTFYYTVGSTSLGDRDQMHINDFSELIQQSTAEAMAYSYIVKYLLSPDVVLAESTVSKNERDLAKKSKGTFLKENRLEYRNKADNGEISYKETMLGGCVKNGECVDRAYKSLTACLECPSARIKLPRLDRAIDEKVLFVKELKPGSRAKSIAKNEVKDLKKYRKKWAQSA